MFPKQSYTVAEITTYIRDLFELDDGLRDVSVSGEISNMTRAASGHWYFTLKDGQAQLRCVMWRSGTERQQFSPQNGDAVVVQGRVGVYEPRGEYQLYADVIRAAGVGDLYAEFERLRKQLEQEGLFDARRKRLLPHFPLRIGVVTSPSAAAFQDVQNVLRRRFPLAEVVLSPTLVQGNDAPPQIAAAIQRLNDVPDIDVILLIRGGGSLEDLWAFNDEAVARAIAASQVPIVSGVGHETDTTIADFVADLRAPTPSAAAELITPDAVEMRMSLDAASDQLQALMLSRIVGLRRHLAVLERSLGHFSPQREIALGRQRLDDWTARLQRSQQQNINQWRERLNSRVAALNAANPYAILQRGYAIVTVRGTNARLVNAADAPAGTALNVHLHDGQLSVHVEATTHDNTDE